MFGWGNSLNGELGLGGIEDERITSPRKVSANFGKSPVKNSRWQECMPIFRFL